MDCVQGAATLESPFHLTEDGIACNRSKSVVGLADWQTMHDRIHLLNALNYAYQLGWSIGWSERKTEL